MRMDVNVSNVGERFVGTASYVGFRSNRPGLKDGDRITLYRVVDLDRMAAHLAVLHIDLTLH